MVGRAAAGQVADVHKETFATGCQEGGWPDCRRTGGKRPQGGVCGRCTAFIGTVVRRYSHPEKVAVGIARSAATRMGGHRCCDGGAVARQKPLNSTVERKEKMPAVRNGGHSCCGGGAAAWQESQSNTGVSKVRMRPMVKHGRGRRIDQRKGLS